jgi:mannosyltransferase
MTILDKVLKSNKQLWGLKYIEWLVVSAGVTFFATISFWTITKSSIWFDEAFGAYIIRFDFLDIARYTANDVHPPLYYWLLKLWTMLFGTSDLALRSMSVLFGVVAIVLVYFLIRKLFSEKVARFSMIFLALSPMLVRYSQEARMYTLVTAIAVAATYMLVIALESKKRKPWVIYGILVGLGMWTHYFSALVWLAHWVWRAIIVKQSSVGKKFIKKFFSKDWILAHIVAIGVFAAWLPFLIYQLLIVQMSGFWIPAVTADTLVNFMTNVVYYQDVANVNGWLAMGFVSAVVVLIYLSITAFRNTRGRLRRSYQLILSLAFVPSLLLFALSMPPLRSSFVDRYMVVSTLFIYAFIGITIALSSQNLRRYSKLIMSVLLVGMLSVGVANVWYLGNYSKTSNASNNTKEIISAIHSNSDGNQPIIANSPWLYYEAVHYATASQPVYFIDADTQYLYGSLDMLKYNDYGKIKDISVFTDDNPVFWYVGLPRGDEFNASYKNWREIQRVEVNDSINGKPAYVAIQYIKGGE